MRAHGVIVNDVPTQFNATSKHSIITTGLTIPLDMLGVVSFLDTSLPQPRDFDTLPWVTLTAPANWVDYASTLPRKNDACLTGYHYFHPKSHTNPRNSNHCILIALSATWWRTIALVNIESTYTIAESLPAINESNDFISAEANY
jgi:hypothetical protein